MKNIGKLILTFILLTFISQSSFAVLDTVYPASGNYNSGSCHQWNKTQTNYIYCYGNDSISGWVKFDISAIPDGSTINSIIFQAYVASGNRPNWSMTPISVNPITAAASTLFADINAEKNSGYYLYVNEPSSYNSSIPTTKNYTLNTLANNNFQTALSADWFAVGISSRNTTSQNYFSMYGWQQGVVWGPKLIVDYTAPSPPSDLSVTSWLTPQSGVGLTASEQVSIQITNYGPYAQNLFTVSYSIDGGNTFVTEPNTNSVSSGNSITYNFTQTANFSGTMTYNCKAVVHLNGDLNTSNDTLSFQVVNSTIINSFPYVQNFDAFPGPSTSPGCYDVFSLINGWVNETSDNKDWCPLSGTTTSANTGPTGDHTSSSGKYIYLEATTCFNQSGLLTSPQINISSLTNPKLSFWYHMYGATMGALHLDIYKNGVWYQDVTTAISGDQGNSWHQKTFDLTAYSGIIKLRFRGITGTSFTSDIAIDDLVITNAVIVNLGPDTSSCIGDTITLDAGSGSGYTYSWRKLPSPATIGFSQTFSVTTSGTYCVDVTDPFSHTSSDTIIVTINPLPVVSFTGLNLNYCANLSDSLTSTFASNNGQTGNMFDITAFNTITIDSFLMNGTSNSLVEVWYRQGTYVGHTSSNAGWTKLGDYVVTSAGQDNPTRLPVGGLTIPANQTYGIYITYTSTASIRYTNGTGTNQIVQNTDMKLECGHGGTYFSLTNTPRVWNGRIFYHNLSTLIGNPSGGTFSGSGISSNTFIPANAGVGTHQIVYTYTDLITGCSNTSTQNTTVNALPNVGFSGLGSSYCINSTAVNLIGSPSGGTFSGSGILGGSFNPNIAGVGNHNITYTFTDANNCTNSHTQSVGVYALPTVSFSGLASSYCLNSSSVNLVGVPSGGTFSGNGISGPGSSVGTNIAPLAVASASTCNTGACSTLNDLNLGTCGTQSIWITSSASNPGSNVFIQFIWPTAHTINKMTIHVGSSTTRFLTGGTIQIWNGTSWINHTTFTQSPGVCSYDIVFSSVSTTRLRIIDITVGGSQSSNVNFREIEIYDVPLSVYTFNPSIAGPGTINISYMFADSIGCSNTSSQSTIVNSLPNVSLANLSSPYCVNANPVTLVGSPSGGSYSGNGVSSNIFTPSVSGAGTHNIIYSYSDTNNCTDSDTQSVVVNALPIASAGTNTSINWGNDTILYGSASGGSSTYSYSWSPADSLINANVQNPSTVILYTTNIFTLTVTDLVTNCQNTSQVTITVVGGILTASTSANPPLICTGDTTTLSACGSGGNGIYTYQWSSLPSGFNSSMQNPVVSPTTTTTYTVTVNDGSNTTSSSTVVTVYQSTAVSFSGLANSYCQYDLVSNLVGTPGGGTFSGVGVVGNTFDPSIAGTGIKNITYYYLNGFGCTSSSMISTTVNPTPAANAGNDAQINCGSPGISIGSAAIWGMTYSWSPVSGLSNSNISNPIAAPNITTNYTLTVIDTSSGCMATDNILITVSGGPTAVTSPDTTICKGSSILIAASGGTGYLWNTGALTSTITVSPSVTTTYTVTVTAGGCADSDSVIVTVNSPSVNLGPDISISSSSPIVLDAGAGFVSYLWSDNSTNQTLLVSYPNFNIGNNTIWVEVTDSTGCIGTDTVVINIISGIEEYIMNDFASIYPNPNKGEFDVKFNSQNNTETKILILNSKGQLVSDYLFTPNNQKDIIHFDLSTYPKGLYFIRIISDKYTINKKIIIQ